MPYSYSQPSDSSDSSGGRRRNYEQAKAEIDAQIELQSKGIPKTCPCGAQAEAVTCFGPLHPGISCENHDDGNEHLRKWVDEAMMEELEKHTEELKHVKEGVSSIRNDLADISFKIQFLTIGDKEFDDEIKKAHHEISQMKEKMVQMDAEIGELKNKSLKVVNVVQMEHVNVLLASVIVLLGLLLIWSKWYGLNSLFMWCLNFDVLSFAFVIVLCKLKA